jgi:hypothetical protein
MIICFVMAYSIISCVKKRSHSNLLHLY